MRNNRAIIIILALTMILFTSCKKNISYAKAIVLENTDKAVVIEAISTVQVQKMR